MSEVWTRQIEGTVQVVVTEIRTAGLIFTSSAFWVLVMVVSHRRIAFTHCIVRAGQLRSIFAGSRLHCIRPPTAARSGRAISPRVTMSSTAVGAAKSVPENSDIVRGQPGFRFSQFVVHGGICTTSGQVSRGGSVTQQTRVILDKIDSLLAEAGTNKSRVLSATVWLADISTIDEMNTVWDQWVDHDNLPVRACVESILVSDDFAVEIQVTAAMPTNTHVSTSVIDTADAAAAVGPYSQAVRVENGTIYVSGCIGLLPGSSGQFAGSTVEEQTKQALANLAAILRAAGPRSRIVKTTVLLHDMADFATVNKLYDAFFAQGGPAEGPVPARSCFAVKALPKGALVEIEAIAVTHN